MFKTPGETESERDKYWERIIKKAREHPYGISSYCLLKKIPKDTYYFWFKKLRPRHPEWKEDLKPQKAKRNRMKAYRSAYRPEIEVLEKPQRRKFTAANKVRILKEIASAGSGQQSAILRREGLYASHIQKWKSEQDKGSLEAKKRGPKENPYTDENRKLRAQNARLQKKLKQANEIIDLQKKISEILGIDLDSTEDE